jgi:GDP-4-dehydro-6-deoxy-D-mannose reductase
MRVLVTGVHGFAGRYLAPAAGARGHQVVGSGVEEEAAASVAERLAGYHPCDITRYSQVEKLLEESRPEGIIHLAGQSSGARSFENPVQAFEINSAGTLHLLEAARRRDFEGPIVVVTSSESYGRISLGRPVDESSPLRPVNPYGASKASSDFAAGIYARAYGLSVIRARAFSHTGPGQESVFVAPSWAEQIAQAEARSAAGEGGPHILKVGNLDPVRDLGDVRDVVEAYLDLLERGRAGEAYNVCTGRGIKLRELIDLYREMARVELTVQDDPGRARPTDIPYLVGNARKIVRELGWKPKHELEETLRALLEHWRTELGVARPAGERT